MRLVFSIFCDISFGDDHGTYLENLNVNLRQYFILIHFVEGYLLMMIMIVGLMQVVDFLVIFSCDFRRYVLSTLVSDFLLAAASLTTGL